MKNEKMEKRKEGPPHLESSQIVGWPGRSSSSPACPQVLTSPMASLDMAVAHTCEKEVEDPLGHDCGDWILLKMLGAPFDAVSPRPRASTFFFFWAQDVHATVPCSTSLTCYDTADHGRVRLKDVSQSPKIAFPLCPSCGADAQDPR